MDAGQRAPDWLYDQGAKPFNTVVEIPRQKDFCDPIRYSRSLWTPFSCAGGTNSSPRSANAMPVTRLWPSSR